MFAEDSPDDHSPLKEWGMSWTDFPVMNLHPHAWPLYSSAKLLGLEFHEKGISFQPTLPLAEYEFTSPLLGFKKTKNGYSGWYAPSVAGRWSVEFKLPDVELAQVSRILVNGQAQPAQKSEKGIQLGGESKPGTPLRWEIS
jgi:hypothetical protein